MTSPVPPRDWTAIHWPDIARSEAARWIAVLPLAATEQHVPNLPLETDVLIGEAYLARVRELLPANAPVTFLPLQPVGVSTEHIDFPGTQTPEDATARLNGLIEGWVVPDPAQYYWVHRRFKTRPEGEAPVY